MSRRAPRAGHPGSQPSHSLPLPRAACRAPQSPWPLRSPSSPSWRRSPRSRPPRRRSRPSSATPGRHRTGRLTQRFEPQLFTTGTGTYTLSSVGIGVGTQSIPPPRWSDLRGQRGQSGHHPAGHHDQSGHVDGPAVNVFTAPANTTLSASTTYWVVTSNSAATNGQGFRVGVTDHTTLDTGTAAGWSRIGNARFKSDIAADLLGPVICLRFADPGTVPRTVTDVLTSANLGEGLIAVAPPFSHCGQTRGLVVPPTPTPRPATTTNAIQDAAGNDAASFTTGSDGVAAVANESTVANKVPADWSLAPTGLASATSSGCCSCPPPSATPRPPTSRTTTPSSRPAPRPATPTSTARASGWSAAAPVDARDNLKPPTPARACHLRQPGRRPVDFYDGSDDEANDKNVRHQR